jgi:hypothetical protein
MYFSSTQLTPDNKMTSLTSTSPTEGFDDFMKMSTASWSLLAMKTTEALAELDSVEISASPSSEKTD